MTERMLSYVDSWNQQHPNHLLVVVELEARYTAIIYPKNTKNDSFVFRTYSVNENEIYDTINQLNFI